MHPASFLSLTLLLSLGTFAATLRTEAGELKFPKPPCTLQPPSGFQNRRVQAALLRLQAGQASVVEAFAEGWAARRFSQTPHEILEAEYLIAAVLAEGGLPHPAYRGLAALAQKATRTPSVSSAVVRGTWSCLANLGETYPSLQFPRNLTTLLPGLIHGSDPELQQAGRAIVFRLLKGELKPGDSSQKTALLSLLEGDTLLHTQAQIWLSARTHQLPSLLQNTERLQTHTPLSAELQLLRAQALYGARQYSEAAEAFKKVEKRDNLSTDALQGLAWSHLQSERYGDAVGVASTLQTGALRKAFTPESWMVTAIALQELCQYADSLRAVQGYRKRYRESYEWIRKWEATPTPLYGPTVRFLRTGQTGGVPIPLATEWLRSPVFQKGQTELNLLLTQGEVFSLHQKNAREVQQRLRADLSKAIRQADAISGGDERAHALQLIRERLKAVRRFDAASPLWEQIALKSARATQKAQARIVHRIQDDLARRTQLAGAALQEIAENLERLEIEIYGDASEDIVWRQAHPEFEGRRSAGEKALSAENAKVWHWGTLASGEIWEDELDSFRADLSNHCDDKESHLAALRKKLPQRASHP